MNLAQNLIPIELLIFLLASVKHANEQKVSPRMDLIWTLIEISNSGLKATNTGQMPIAQ